MKQLRLSHAHKIFNNVCPSYLKNNLIKINEQHQHNTRLNYFTYVTPKIKGIKSTTFYHNAIQEWNNVCFCVQNNPFQQ